MDFDPRDYDSRDDDRSALDRHHRGMSHSYDELDRDGHLRLPDTRDRDDDARDLGRGPGDSRQSNDKHGHDPRDEERWPDRDRDHDPRDVFTRDLDLPRGRERAIVHDRDREYTLRGSESRTLATVGAFRVVSSRDLRDHDDRPTDPRSGDLRHLREQGLIETTRVPGSRDYAVSLTKEGRSLLESHRDGDREGGQTFYAGVKRERELEHDVQVYRAFEREAERLEERSARIDRVVLDYELKREYQVWLHERDRDRDDYDGHPDRDSREIELWAHEHDLPYFDEQVHFPDLRIEYEEIDGRRDNEDVEVLTINYRGAHGAAAARSGFSCYCGSSARIGGRGGSGGRGSGHLGGLAEEFLD
jgi:DNA-binding MarR family transcriptional regulator